MGGCLNSDGNEEGRGENERRNNNSKEMAQQLYGNQLLYKLIKNIIKMLEWKQPTWE